MNIELSAKEYRDLLDVLHIADVIMSGHRRGEDKRTERHRELIQKLYALAGGEGLDRLIRYNESAHKHVPTEEFEQNTPAHAVVEEFATNGVGNLTVIQRFSIGAGIPLKTSD